MEISDIGQRLEQFLRESYGIAEDDPGFNHAVDLFEAGYVDSVGIIETLAYITDAFGVEIPDEALLSDSFASIGGMAQVIAELIQEAADAKRAARVS
ncbi:phosphopantetheine-binding protein [Azospirillum sp. sgz302134]